MNRERFRFLRVIHHESDLLVGVSHSSDIHGIEDCVKRELIRLRQILQEYAERDPRFMVSLDPIDLLAQPFQTGKIASKGVEGGRGAEAEELLTMVSCGQKTGTGPMSAVAGLFAEMVGRKVIETYTEMEVVVENGGDLYLRNRTNLVSVIHAGTSALSDKMAFVVPPGEWGLCTSSGTMGHSLSGGKADAVTVISPSAPLADAWATAMANQVQNAADIERVLESVAGIPEILGCAIIVDNQIGIRGEIEVKLLPKS